MQKTFDIPRELMTEEELVQPGGLSCQGCAAAVAMKLALKGLGRRTVVVMPACCWSVIAGPYPYSALRLPFLHVPFETAAVAASGVRAACSAIAPCIVWSRSKLVSVRFQPCSSRSSSVSGRSGS